MRLRIGWLCSRQEIIFLTSSKCSSTISSNSCMGPSVVHELCNIFNSVNLLSAYSDHILATSSAQQTCFQHIVITPLQHLQFIRLAFSIQWSHPCNIFSSADLLLAYSDHIFATYSAQQTCFQHTVITSFQHLQSSRQSTITFFTLLCSWFSSPYISYRWVRMLPNGCPKSDSKLLFYCKARGFEL